MSDNPGDCGLTSRPDLSVNSFCHVQNPNPERESPCLVTDAVIPELLAFERTVRKSVVANEAPSCVGVEAEHKNDKKMVSVPEGLEALFSDIRVRGREHEQHAQ